MFEIFLTDEARDQLNRLKTDKGLERRYKAVKKAIGFLSSNPRHKSLKTHEFTKRTQWRESIRGIRRTINSCSIQNFLVLWS